jgi:hypothetical protein
MRLVGYAFAGVEPEMMGVGPIPATEKALAKAGLTIDDIGLFEINEAFAVQVLAFLEHYGIADDDARVNQYGGAIAYGHPLASSGVRLMTSWPGPSRTVRRSGTASRRCASASAWVERSLGEPHHADYGAGDAERRLPGGRTDTTAFRRVVTGPSSVRRPATRCRQGGADHSRQRPTTKPNTLGPASLLELDEHWTPPTASPQWWRFASRSRSSGHRRDLNGVALVMTRAGRRDRPPGPPRVRSARRRPGPDLRVRERARTRQGSSWLNCTYRTVHGAVAGMALPETFLGLVPGWGGSWRCRT